MVRGQRHPLVFGAGITGLGTLACRVLGMIRDMATASLLGLSGGGVMDAFVVAFRIPNLFRRLFGEGALAASYVPVLARRLEQDRAAAWQLASVVFTWLSVLLAALLLAATLQCLSEFRVPALAPTLLNLCWLVGAWGVAPWFAGDREAQAYVIAIAVLVAGGMQLAVQLPKLRALGFRFDYRWDASREHLFEIVRSMGPMVLGLAVTQINTLLDSLIAWGLSATPERGERIAWLGGAVVYPMQQGAALQFTTASGFTSFPWESWALPWLRRSSRSSAGTRREASIKSWGPT